MKRNRFPADLRLILGAAVALCAAVLIAPLPLRADFHVSATVRVEPAPEWGRQASNLTLDRDWWFGRTIMTFTAREWRYIFDKSRSRILVVNLVDSYYVEAPMTADVRDLVDPAFLATLGRTRVDGTVARSPQKMTVLGAECQGTVVSEWVSSESQHLFDRDRTVYACPGVPFDWTMARDLTTWMVSFFNPQMAYFGGLRSIQGFPLAETVVATRNTQRVSYGLLVDAITESPPPAGIYEVPAGAVRHEKLTQRDIQAMRQIQYLMYFY
jgi:hypothetical protein